MRENKDDIIYVSINNLKSALLNELKPKWTFIDNDIDIIESYCVMCSILGNDFIPHILTLNMKNNGLNKLIDITTKAIEKTGSLIRNNEINKDCLSLIFASIAENEETELLNEISKVISKKPVDFTLKSQEFALKNKDELLNDIYCNNKKWRYNYYKSLFDININNDSSLISVIVSNFIKGIYWTYNYYKKFDLDLEWFYPYNFPPTSRDISNYLKVINEPPVIKKNGNFLPAKYQLLLILPIQSSHLLEFDKNLISLITDHKQGFTHLFPSEFTEGKNNMLINGLVWMGEEQYMKTQIEEKLAGKIDVRFFIASKEDKELGEKVILVVEGEKQAIDDAIFADLDKYEKPKEIVFVPKFKETPTGKILRNETLL